MLLIDLDRQGPEPLYLQITKHIQKLIESKVLQVGGNLPSTRELAKQLGTHRSTVYRAYEELWALGFIESRPGSKTRIRYRPERVFEDKTDREGIINWDQVITPSSRSLFELYQQHKPEGKGDRSDCIDLAALDMDRRLIPADVYRRCLNNALRKGDRNIFGYGNRAGYRPLRSLIAQRMQIHGIEISADEIIITNGSQNGIDMILRILAVPGSPVFVESPTYALILPLLRFYRAKVTGIPMRDKGLDLDDLSRKLRDCRPALLYTMPNFQNPTGITTEQSHRERLLSLCEEYKVPIVEDGFEEEMKYFGKVALPIKSMDRSKLVLYLGTFSKILMPGVRIGWIAADRTCIDRLLALKRFCDLSSNSITQVAMAEFCAEGHYDLHVKRMHRVFRKRMQVALDAMDKYMPADLVTWTRPTGGYLIWVTVNDGINRFPLTTELFHAYGVSISSGNYYFPEFPEKQHFRLSISTLGETEIIEGMRRLGQAFRAIVH